MISYLMMIKATEGLLQAFGVAKSDLMKSICISSRLNSTAVGKNFIKFSQNVL